VSSVAPNIGDTKPDYGLSWVVGWLTLDRGDNEGYPGPNNPDNTNTMFLMNSLLWNYHYSDSSHRIPMMKGQ
jgi:hypothetical protein